MLTKIRRVYLNSWFAANISIPTKAYKKITPIKVRISGVGFFDFLHGQTGVAPNGRELHPILNIVKIN